MPVTAKLSRKFYDTLGEEVTNELVDWLNAVDTGYRSEFRELFETHFARFEARLAQQTAELRAEFDAKLARLGAELRVELAETKASLMRWMFLFWVGQVAVTIGAIIAARQLLH